MKELFEDETFGRGYYDSHINVEKGYKNL